MEQKRGEGKGLSGTEKGRGERKILKRSGKLCPGVGSRTPIQTMSDEFSTLSCEATYAPLKSYQTQS